MTDRPQELLADIIAVHGGDLVGRIRLQKVVYILDQLGLNSGFEYSYHHYGPYSAEVASALMDAQSERMIVDEQKFRQSDGASYSVFHTDRKVESERVGDLSRDVICGYASRMKRESATVLELAATIHWLKYVECLEDWQTELRQRKGSKTGSGRQEQAVQLLSEVGLYS